MGWYEEDPDNNPEDPTVGALFMRVPAANGNYTGLMPFSYVGCSAGVDVGSISGTRTDNALAGNWAGTLDGVDVGGSFSADFTDGSSPARFDGTFSNDAGKQPIVAGPCSYYMAAQGRFRLFDAPASEPAGVAVSFSATNTTPTISWAGVTAGATTTLRVFDEACLETLASAACYLGEATSTGTSLAYPEAFPAAQALTVGGRYLVMLTAQTAPTGPGGRIAAFASTRFSPTEAGNDNGGGGGDDDDDGGGDNGGGGSSGSLSVTGMPGFDTFTPGGPLAVSGPDTNGPTCMGSGSFVVCSSGWTTGWTHPLAGSDLVQLLVMVGSATTSEPGPAPGSRLDTVSIQITDSRGGSTHLYSFTCGTMGVACAADLGVSIDLQARTIRFDGLALEGRPPVSSGTVTLTGSIGF